MKLKQNWKRIKGPVYESCNGVRIHVGGLICFNDQVFNVNSVDLLSKFWRFERLNGGNRKRALMALAESMFN